MRDAPRVIVACEALGACGTGRGWKKGLLEYSGYEQPAPLTLDEQERMGAAFRRERLTGGEGLWKQVFTCWEHFRLCHKGLPMFRPDTFHSHLKCNLNICL